MGVRRERVGEEDDEIDATFGDRGTDLLVTPERSAEVTVDRQVLGYFAGFPLTGFDSCKPLVSPTSSIADAT